MDFSLLSLWYLCSSCVFQPSLGDCDLYRAVRALLQPCTATGRGSVRGGGSNGSASDGLASNDNSEFR